MIFLGNVEGPLLEVKDHFESDEECSTIGLKESEIKANLKPEHFPCAILANETKLAIQFLNYYKKLISDTKSKVVLVPLMDLNEKQIKQLYGLGAFDVITGKESNTKTIAHKAKLALKTIPKIDEGKFDNLRVERLITPDKEDNPLSAEKRREIDYEIVDYLAVEKMCTASLKKLNKIEEALEEFENSRMQVQLRQSAEIFAEIQNSARVNNFTPLEEFIEIPSTIKDIILSTKDEALVDILTGLLFNSIDLLRYEFKSIKEKKLKKMLVENPHKALFNRYRWLGQRMVDLNQEDKITPIMDNLGI